MRTSRVHGTAQGGAESKLPQSLGDFFNKLLGGIRRPPRTERDREALGPSSSLWLAHLACALHGLNSVEFWVGTEPRP
jgi:hypothetical protein